MRPGIRGGRFEGELVRGFQIGGLARVVEGFLVAGRGEEVAERGGPGSEEGRRPIVGLVLLFLAEQKGRF